MIWATKFHIFFKHRASPTKINKRWNLSEGVWRFCVGVCRWCWNKGLTQWAVNSSHHVWIFETRSFWRYCRENQLKTISPQERVIINNVITIVKIVLITSVTSATPEMSFPLARRVITWLWSSMTQKSLNALTLLDSHKDIVDKLSLVATGNEFVDNLPNRRNNLGTFSDFDLH